MNCINKLVLNKNVALFLIFILFHCKILQMDAKIKTLLQNFEKIKNERCFSHFFPFEENTAVKFKYYRSSNGSYPICNTLMQLNKKVK